MIKRFKYIPTWIKTVSSNNKIYVNVMYLKEIINEYGFRLKEVRFRYNWNQLINIRVLKSFTMVLKIILVLMFVVNGINYNVIELQPQGEGDASYEDSYAEDLTKNLSKLKKKSKIEDIKLVRSFSFSFSFSNNKLGIYSSHKANLLSSGINIKKEQKLNKHRYYMNVLLSNSFLDNDSWRLNHLTTDFFVIVEENEKEKLIQGSLLAKEINGKKNNYYTFSISPKINSLSEKENRK